MKIKYLITLWSAIAIFASYFFAYTPLLVCVCYGALSLTTYLIYLKDKSAAKSKTWRIPEKTLQLLALCGGWLGAVLAQETLRHKTQKSPFLLVFWLAVLLNMSVFTALHLKPFNRSVRQTMEMVSGVLSNEESKNGLISQITILFQYSR